MSLSLFVCLFVCAMQSVEHSTYIDVCMYVLLLLFAMVVVDGSGLKVDDIDPTCSQVLACSLCSFEAIL
jgi:hypothetical protein